MVLGLVLGLGLVLVLGMMLMLILLPLPLLLLWVHDGWECVGRGCACATVILVVVGVVWVQHPRVGAGRHGLPPDLRHGNEVGVEEQCRTK